LEKNVGVKLKARNRGVVWDPVWWKSVTRTGTEYLANVVELASTLSSFSPGPIVTEVVRVLAIPLPAKTLREEMAGE
jgi:hypothetical protein